MSTKKITVLRYINYCTDTPPLLTFAYFKQRLHFEDHHRSHHRNRSANCCVLKLARQGAFRARHHIKQPQQDYLTSALDALSVNPCACIREGPWARRYQATRVA